jgi:hypothetical protein
MAVSLASLNVLAKSPEDQRSVTEAANMDQRTRSAMAESAHVLCLPFPNSAASPDGNGMEILVAGVGDRRTSWWSPTGFMAPGTLSVRVAAETGVCLSGSAPVLAGFGFQLRTMASILAQRFEPKRPSGSLARVGFSQTTRLNGP